MCNNTPVTLRFMHQFWSHSSVHTLIFSPCFVLALISKDGPNIPKRQKGLCAWRDGAAATRLWVGFPVLGPLGSINTGHNSQDSKRSWSLGVKVTVEVWLFACLVSFDLCCHQATTPDLCRLEPWLKQLRHTPHPANEASSRLFCFDCKIKKW